MQDNDKPITEKELNDLLDNFPIIEPIEEKPTTDKDKE